MYDCTGPGVGGGDTSFVYDCTGAGVGGGDTSLVYDTLCAWLCRHQSKGWRHCGWYVDFGLVGSWHVVVNASLPEYCITIKGDVMSFTITCGLCKILYMT